MTEARLVVLAEAVDELAEVVREMAEAAGDQDRAWRAERVQRKLDPVLRRDVGDGNGP